MSGSIPVARLAAVGSLVGAAALGFSVGMAACSGAADNVQPERGTEASVPDPGTDGHVDPGTEPSTEAGPSVGPEASGVDAADEGAGVTGGDAPPEAGHDAAADTSTVRDSAIDTGADGGYPLKYQQTFDSPASLADLLFANPAGWQHEMVDGHGAVSITGTTYVPPFASPTRIALIALRQFGSFVLDVEVMQTGIDYGHRDACFFFGVQDPSHFYYAHLATAQDAVAHQIHIVNGAPRTAITRTSTTGFDWGRDVWRHIHLVRDIDTGLIEVYSELDPGPVLTASDKTFGTGYVGFGSFDDTARFRNVTIYAKSAVEGAPKFFSAKP